MSCGGGGVGGISLDKRCQFLASCLDKIVIHSSLLFRFCKPSHIHQLLKLSSFLCTLVPGNLSLLCLGFEHRKFEKFAHLAHHICAALFNACSTAVWSQMAPISAFFDLDSFAYALFLASRKILDSIISVRITSFLELTASWQKRRVIFYQKY